MKTLASLGEEAVVAALTQALPTRSDVRAGAGDDCAVIGGPRDAWWRLLKTDALVEGVHFLPDEKPGRVGWKALCRAISDIAAMGGLPEHALVTLAVRTDTAWPWVRDLYAGLSRAARKFGVAIVGGETSKSPGPVFLSIAMAGRVERTRCVLRSGAFPENMILVTGRLGGSLLGKHLDFIPRLTEARWLVEHFRPTAMMDLSDGLAADLPRLARASGYAYELWESKVPRTRGCTVQQALGDGEDFELLLTIEQPQVARLLRAWRKKFPRVPLTLIGRVLKGCPPPLDSDHCGYDHFA
jgi:thiamine-monophosphate kinase